MPLFLLRSASTFSSGMRCAPRPRVPVEDSIPGGAKCGVGGVSGRDGWMGERWERWESRWEGAGKRVRWEGAGGRREQVGIGGMEDQGGRGGI